MGTIRLTIIVGMSAACGIPTFTIRIVGELRDTFVSSGD
jgi:hypothetical protein